MFIFLNILTDLGLAASIYLIFCVLYIEFLGSKPFSEKYIPTLIRFSVLTSRYLKKYCFPYATPLGLRMENLNACGRSQSLQS